jgi:hypothetical protein
MSDGASQGIKPERALKTILGGEPPPDDDEGMSRQEMRDAILAVDVTKDPETYDEAAMLTARLIYDFVMEDPFERRKIPPETEYDWDGDPDRGSAGMKPEYIKAVGLYDVMKDHGIPLASLGLSGFQWGWAVNAARYALSEPPVPNPAIVTIGE